MGTENQRTNWELLGLCRAWLAFIVLCSHTHGFYGYTRVLRVAALSPFTAVLAFLVLSGYSIHHSYQSKKGFYWRRLERLLPVFVVSYVLCLMPYAAAAYLNRPPTTPIGDLPSAKVLLGDARLLSAGLARPRDSHVWAGMDAGTRSSFLCLLSSVREAQGLSGLRFLVASFLTYCAAPDFGVPLEDMQGTFWVPAQFAWAWLLGWQMYRQPGDISGMSCNNTWRHGSLVSLALWRSRRIDDVGHHDHVALEKQGDSLSPVR